MTVQDLIQALEDLDPEAEVRIASIGPRTDLEYQAGELRMVTLEVGKTLVYLAEGLPIGYLAGPARAAFGT